MSLTLPPITPQEFANRRNALFQKMPNNSLAIVPGAQRIYRNADTEYPFRQDSDFYYLTGFEEPNAIAVLVKNQNKDSQFILFNEEPDLKTAQWTGQVAGSDVLSTHQVNLRFNIQDFSNQLSELMLNRPQVFYSFAYFPETDIKMLQILQKVRHVQRRQLSLFEAFRELKPLIAELRVVKSPAEIELISKSGQIAGLAHKKLMHLAKPDKPEYVLEAAFLEAGFAAGCRGMAYTPIIAGGANACVLHYTQNQDRLSYDQLLLVDAGVEYQYYASDITRTYPVSGKFNSIQKILYDVVLAAQTAAIAIIKPGLPYENLQKTIVNTIIDGLLTNQIIKGKREAWLENERYKVFYMHGSGHWLGLDVHDAGDYRTGDNESRLIEENMVFTVEPGLYLSPHCDDIDPKFRGVGIRIEDDIVVTKTGHQNLTPDAPKTIAEIEEWMATGVNH